MILLIYELTAIGDGLTHAKTDGNSTTTTTITEKGKAVEPDETAESNPEKELQRLRNNTAETGKRRGKFAEDVLGRNVVANGLDVVLLV